MLALQRRGSACGRCASVPARAPRRCSGAGHDTSAAAAAAAAPQRGAHRQRVAAAAAAAPRGGDGEARPVMLNDEHTLWLQAAGGDRPALLFGGNFVLRAAATAAAAPPAPAGLVPWRRPGGLSLGPRRAPGPASLRDAALVVLPATPRGIVPLGGEPVALTGEGFVEAEAVEAEVLPALDAPTTAIVPRAQMGVVPAAPAALGLSPAAGGAGGDAAAAAGAPRADGVYESFSSSPRRGHKIKFTCRRCGATSIRPVNIHAWREGTVFARCGRCRVTHKLIDNLKLFHEMSGAVYDGPHPPLEPGRQSGLPPGLQLRLEELAAPGEGGAAPAVGGFDGFGDWRPGGNGGSA
ncbi:hypothetical protein Rsub_05381 [Raphidocelis subcapitata]|uniref:DNL-type domain-containing protein n=1 Tax=Raphidocelis subcapitata TaxID=307507 RepID=A0A2V0NXD4_9CHLO|nr:hypothetical protein Rsub_05381 [Raphidocelis subcapitata]|eukprot:GBF92298.1 hypothetical protein Rsub_05381 [Raphidocelis subcapitata]